MISKIQNHIKNKTLFLVIKNKIRNKIFTSRIRHLILKLPLTYSIEKFIIPKDYIGAYIKPETVEYTLNNNHNKFRHNPQGFVLWGEWDRYKTKLRSDSTENDRRVIYLTINQLFVEGICFKQSEQYLYMKTMIKENGKSYWCTSVEDLEQYFRILMKTYEGIKKYGYMTEDELNRSKPNLINKSRRDNLTDEIKICIDRKGIPVLGSGGTHRLLIADLLEIKKVPVIIQSVHNLWLDEICQKHQLGMIPSIKKELKMKGWKL